MYGEQLISELAYGIHPITPNQPPQNRVLGYLSPRPAARAPRGRGVPGHFKILEGVQDQKKNLFPDMQ